MPYRLSKINHQIQRELSDLLLREVNDPRLGVMVTITEVTTAPDLSRSRVMVSIMGTPEEKVDVLKALAAASRFLHRQLGDRLQLRRTPDLDFVRDDSIQHGADLLDLIYKANKGESA
ncbi:MAG: 30S ribosome-binding factor RbfA [Dehalococcoidia bacterium]|nr:30S ribosome-binding factor RbfA [Dehalococcoidia bacterium]